MDGVRSGRLLEGDGLSLAESDGSGGPSGEEDESDGDQGDSGTDSTGGGGRDGGSVLPDGIGHSLALFSVELGFGGGSKLGKFGVGVASGLGREVAVAAGVVDGVEIGGVVDEGDVGTGVTGVVSRTGFPVHLEGHVLAGSETRRGQVGEGETGRTSVSNPKVAPDRGKVAGGLGILVGRVGKLEELGIFDGGDRDVTSV